jgi:uncharacterized OB-fold protein
MSDIKQFYLPEGLPIPVPELDQLSKPYWEGLLQGRLMVQCCSNCKSWQFGPEWICYQCHSFDLDWENVGPEGVIYSWERVWHPSHTVLKNHGPYIAVLVELPDAGGIRMVGNLLGDPLQDVQIGASVVGVFEAHTQATPPYGLLHWQIK